MRSIPISWVAAALMSLAPACSLLSRVGPAPQLLSGNVAKIDFESDALNQSPEGFEPKLGRWSVADSPTATSGTQVVVRGGDEAASLAPKNAEGVRSAGGEVSVRVFLGSAGAGLACESREGSAGYTLKLEPGMHRVALYRKTGDVQALVGATPLAAPKGAWSRIGLRCESGRIIAYVDGKPVIRDRSSLGSFDLELSVDPGVTAQFDDLAYWASK